jgi:enoyl-CoA hydratase
MSFELSISPELGCRVSEGVAVVTLEAPQRRNAFTTELVDALITLFDELESRPEVRAVVVTGAPPAFCAGAALGHLASPGATDDERRTNLMAIYQGFLRVARSPLATVAAVNGPAVGAGMNLALACDLRVAGRSARFDARFLALGLHPGGGHTWMAQRAMGTQAATAALLFGQRLDAMAALACGLVWEVAEDEALVPRCVELATLAASMDPELVQRTKATLAVTAGLGTLDEAVAYELEVQVWSMSQPAFRDGPVGRGSM